MRLLDLTLPSPEENLALDEALLSDQGPPVLRLWESPSFFVVLGRSSRLSEEVDRVACADRGVPVLRRVTGGATILTGPGCLMYAVTIDLLQQPKLADLTAAHRYVLQRVATALRPIEPSLHVAGTSDLAVSRGDRLLKVSGNSLRRTQKRLLYHGTLCYRIDPAMIGELLRVAPRQPDYRAGRGHAAFVGNLSAEPPTIKRQLASEWGASPFTASEELLQTTQRLVRERYALAEWHESR